jgi:hypothetical protein
MALAPFGVVHARSGRPRMAHPLLYCPNVCRRALHGCSLSPTYVLTWVMHACGKRWAPQDGRPRCWLCRFLVCVRESTAWQPALHICVDVHACMCWEPLGGLRLCCFYMNLCLQESTAWQLHAKNMCCCACMRRLSCKLLLATSACGRALHGWSKNQQSALMHMQWFGRPR